MLSETEYLIKRIDDQQDWHSNKSIYCQKWYKRLTIAEAVLVLAIPIVAFIPCDTRIYVIFIGVITSALKFINIQCNYHELWIKYRLIAEALKKEKYLYQTGTGIYKNEKTRFNLLVQNTEQILQEGNTVWSAISSAECHPEISQGS